MTVPSAADPVRVRLAQISEQFELGECSHEELNAAAALTAAVNAVLDLTAKARHGATRWADPLPVPEWVDRVELAVAAALRVTE